MKILKSEIRKIIKEVLSEAIAYSPVRIMQIVIEINSFLIGKNESEIKHIAKTTARELKRQSHVLDDKIKKIFLDELLDNLSK